jgi:hypothetical protein
MILELQYPYLFFITKKPPSQEVDSIYLLSGFLAATSYTFFENKAIGQSNNAVIIYLHILLDFT